MYYICFCRIRYLRITIFLIAILIFTHTQYCFATEKKIKFFPFGVYIAAEGFNKNAEIFDYSLFNSYELALIDMKKKYVNIVSVENVNQFIDNNKMDEILDISFKYNMKIWASYEIPKNLSNETLKNLFAIKLKPHSNKNSLFAWAIRDEPKLNEIKYLGDAVILLRNVDNRKKIGFVHGGKGRAVKELERYTDFVAVDDYPIYEHYKNPGSIAKTTIKAINKTRKPVWIVLQAHSWIDRHIQSTPAELRLMTHLAIANGAKGIFYFMYNYRPYWIFKYIEHSLVDVWLNPSPLWDEVESIGKRLTAIGPLLLSTSPLLKKEKEINIKGSNKVSAKFLRDTKDDIYYFIIYNNDTSKAVNAMIEFKEKNYNNKAVYDLYEMIDYKKIKPLLSGFELYLKPGEGKVFAICDSDDFKNISSKIWTNHFSIEKNILKIEIDKLKISGFNTSKVQQKIQIADSLLDKNSFKALNTLEEAQHMLEELKRNNLLYTTVQNNIEKTRALFIAINEKLNTAVNNGNNKYIEKYKNKVTNLSKVFFNLEIIFNKGQYTNINESVLKNLANTEALLILMIQ